MGCKVGPEYARPKASVPAAYRELSGWKPAEPRDLAARGSWWKVFNDPELDALEERVSQSNQSLAAAVAQLRQARALVAAARAGFFPTATLGASLTRSRSSSGATQGVFNPGRLTTNYLLPLEASWEPDVWGRVRRNVEANLANELASAADLESMRLMLQADLAQDYFQLHALDAERQILEETATALRRSLELTQNRYSSGVASRIEVLQAETQLKTTVTQQIDLGVQRAQLEHAIAVLAGLPPADLTVPVRPLPQEVPAVPVGIPSELLERRPDIAAAERRMVEANARIGVAVAAYFPSFTLSASAGLESTEASRWFNWASRFWSIGPAVTETVFQGGLRGAQTDEARAAYDAAVASYRQTVLEAMQEVEDNLAALRILAEEARAEEDLLTSARQAVTVSMNQYRAGTINYLNVIVAQAAALTNERAAVNIRSRRLVACAVLIKALGGGWEASRLEEAAGKGPQAGPGVATP